LVADLHPDAERRGAERAKLQADGERRLQQAGIHALTEDQRILSVSRLSSLRDEIRAAVDRFIDAYRKENARP
jgi:hypothetical protein